MDYKSLETKILDKLQRNKKCDKVIKENNKLIKEYFIDVKDSSILKNFINNLNEVVLNSKKYGEIEKFLKHPAMTQVLEAFRNSDILIRALQNKNKSAAKWLLTMNVNTNVRDKLGRTALMYACSYWEFESITEKLVKENPNSINITDEDGNTALYHAVKIKNIFDKLVVNKIDINHRNKDGDTIFTYICRCHKPKCLKSLFQYHPDIDLSVVNNDERTGAMYLAESDNFTELRGLYSSKRNLNLGYQSKKGDTIVSLTIQRYYDQFKHGIDASDQAVRDKLNGIGGKYYNRQYSRVYDQAKNMARTINALIDIGCDFNCSIDGDGNTPMIFFLTIKDYVSALNLLQYYQNLNLSRCNKYGISASYLGSILTPSDFESLNNIKNDIYMKINYEIFVKALNSNKTYKSEDIIEMKKNNISPYQVPERILSLQSALSEGYFARSGELTDQNAADFVDYLSDKYLKLQYGQKI
ncbi:ankyrin [Anaeromyces robustus]|uniref:Ankyrin n=1 Tax=Anaeromyces robustus TaxID=1754192 RepID=A0A1Y1WIK7_9FUNG|nr:ankyrin [Anaeromyces robustus]|eukprot:ORX73410.1 ankyrin [Anaeromyces robustus]